MNTIMTGRRSLLGGLLAAPVLARRATAQTATWQGYSYVPSATLASYRGLERMAQAIGQETGGRVAIRLNVGGSLPVNVANITQAVGDGVLQFAADGFFTGSVPIAGILRLPMLLNSPQAFDRALAAVREPIERQFERRGVVVLAHYRYPLQVAWSNQRLTALSEMAGQRLRVTSPEQGEFVRRLRGVPVTIGGPEVPSALSTGTVSGVFTAASAGGRLWREQLRFGYLLGPNFFNSVVIVNRDAWERLPEPVRAQVKAAAERVAPTITADMAQEEITAIQELAAGGMTITEPTQADIGSATQLMASYWDEWAGARGSEGRDLLARIRAAIA